METIEKSEVSPMVSDRIWAGNGTINSGRTDRTVIMTESEQGLLESIKFGGPTLYDPVSLMVTHADVYDITFESGAQENLFPSIQIGKETYKNSIDMLSTIGVKLGYHDVTDEERVR